VSAEWEETRTHFPQGSIPPDNGATGTSIPPNLRLIRPKNSNDLLLNLSLCRVALLAEGLGIEFCERGLKFGTVSSAEVGVHKEVRSPSRCQPEPVCKETYFGHLRRYESVQPLPGITLSQKMDVCECGCFPKLGRRYHSSRPWPHGAQRKARSCRWEDFG